MQAALVDDRQRAGDRPAILLTSSVTSALYFPPQELAGDVDVFAAGLLGFRKRVSMSLSPRTLASLISIGRLTPAMTSTRPGLHHRDRKVGRRAAEHVGQDDHAGAVIDSGDRVQDVLAALFHVVLGTDGRPSRTAPADRPHARAPCGIRRPSWPCVTSTSPIMSYSVPRHCIPSLLPRPRHPPSDRQGRYLGGMGLRCKKKIAVARPVPRRIPLQGRANGCVDEHG